MNHSWPDQRHNPPPIGYIALTASYPALMSFRAAFFNPRIFIDGYEVGRGWGRKVFPSWPGHHHFHVHVHYWAGDTYHTDIAVNVATGNVVELLYTAPAGGFGSASLGYAQRR